MSLSFALILSAVIPTQTPPPNLDFAWGKLTRWEGEGFHVLTEPFAAVSSADGAVIGRVAILHRTFVLPADAGAVTFRAAAIRPEGVAPGPLLDIVLEGTARRMAPRLVRGDKGLQAAPQLLPAVNGRLREYVWSVEGFAGQTVRIALLDQDDRPGCYVVSSGFKVWSRDEFNGTEFSDLMLRLSREKRLPPPVRFDTKHFLAISNADDAFTQRQLFYCEQMNELFFDHFRRKGFTVTLPNAKLMVAIFDSPEGFEAYLGRRVSNIITGVYHPGTNRLVIYDYGQNRGFKASTDGARDKFRQIPPTLEGKRAIDAINRSMREFREDTNVGTVMHELAHQLSFNSGLLNRNGDVPLWLAEGLACYFEGTERGSWLGPGGANPNRAATLAKRMHGDGPSLSLRALVSSDDWLRRSREDTVLLGYAESWALFRLLMEERPDALRKYLTMIAPRRTPDHRFADFMEGLGDFNKLEKRYEAYLKEIVKQQVK